MSAIETIPGASPGACKSTYETTLGRLAVEDPRVVVLTAENRAAIRALPALLGHRFVDVGICEQTMVGMAAGLALRGRIPVAHALATFLTLRAFEFIRTDVGIGGLPVKLIGGVPGLLSEANGPTHQALDDLAVMRTIPGMSIVCPADEDDLCMALPSILSAPGPVYVRHNARPLTTPVAHRPFVLGRAERLAHGRVAGGAAAEGADIEILALGLLVSEALEAAALLSTAAVSVGVTNVRSLVPIDEAAVVSAARRAHLLVTIEDHFLVGGLYQSVCEILVRNGLAAVAVLPIGFDGRYFAPGLLAEVIAHEKLSGPALAARILAAWSRRRRGWAPAPALLAPVSSSAADGAGARARGHLADEPNASWRDHRLSDPSPDDSSPIRFMPHDPPIAASEALFARGARLIPGATQTLAKGPGQHVRGFAPKYLRRGRGARVWDLDDNEYLDFTMAVGPLSLGYGDPVVDAAIRAQLADGITFSLPHPLEVEVAELIHDIVPGAEQVRFGKNGCDVTTAAVRLARAATGRNKVLCCGYHGWHDWYIGVTDRNRGVPSAVSELTHTFSYNDLASVEAALCDDTACVILEPVTFESPRDDFLARLKALCAARGALLIFDEMWTGFRLALGGAQERFGVTADLACFSKAVANGMPLSILTGRADVMRLCARDVFFYSTFGGETLSLAAARATIGELRRRDVPAGLDRLGCTLRDGYNQLAGQLGMAYTRCVGHGCRTLVAFDSQPAGARGGQLDSLVMKSFVQQELLRRGILWSGFHNLAAAHAPGDIQLLMAAYREILPTLREGVAAGDLRARLRGEPVEPIFRRTGQFNTKPVRERATHERRRERQMSDGETDR